MSRISELIESIREKYYEYTDAEFSEHGIEEIMKEYAEHYLQTFINCLEDSDVTVSIAGIKLVLLDRIKDKPSPPHL